MFSNRFDLKNIIPVFLIILFIILFGCKAQSEQSELVVKGSWKFESIMPINNSMDNEAGLSSLLFLNVEAEGSIWNFNDGQIHISKNNIKQSDFDYKISENKLYIINGNEKEIFVIEELNEHHLLLISEDQEVQLKLKR